MEVDVGAAAVGDHGGLGWTTVDKEPGKQAAVERAQRLGQTGLAFLDAADG